MKPSGRDDNDAVEPENRLVARSLERAWEERLRASEEIEDAYRRWRLQDPIVLKSEDHEVLEALA